MLIEIARETREQVRLVQCCVVVQEKFDSRFLFLSISRSPSLEVCSASASPSRESCASGLLFSAHSLVLSDAARGEATGGRLVSFVCLA